MSSRHARLTAVALFYTLSGALGLVYEVVFDKYLAYVFGATAYASSAVLVAFMGGLALGAFVASRIDARIERPLLAYGIAELVIGAFCLAVPHTFGALSSLYVSAVTKSPGSLATLSIVRALLAVLVVLVPAAGMGATLPLLSRFVQGNEPALAKRRLARFYALNTFGGAMGAIGSAYVILPTLGLTWTMRTCACLSLGIGLASVVLGLGVFLPRAAVADEERTEETAKHAELGDASASMPFRDAVVLSAASGLLVFACEVVFVHMLALVIGTSVYAFGLMLFIFLVCLSAGTPLATRLATRHGAMAAAFGFAAAGTGLVASLVIWDRLPGLFVALGPSVRTWGARELTRGVAAFAALAIPVALMGTTFPLVLRSARAASLGADVGRLTVANTVGSITGSILGGFFLLPLLGSQKSLMAIGVLYLAVAAYVLRSRIRDGRSASKRGSLMALVAIGALVAALVPPWNLARLTSGANVYFDTGTVPDGVVESIREDVHGGVTTVVRDAAGVRTLLTNGKFQGNDGREIGDNRGLAHLPVAFARFRQNAMVIGLGTGASADAIAAYDFERIDVAELSPAIVDAARGVFGELNHYVLNDPRVHLRLEDGRNLLLTGKEEYDVVTIEVSSIWFAGASNVYTKEFYDLVAGHLSDGGILQQWFQLHHTNRRIVTTQIATLRAVFPFILVAVTGHQGQLIASKTPLRVTRQKLYDLEKVGSVPRVLGDRHLVDYVKGVLLDPDDVDAFLDDAVERLGTSFSDLIASDDNLFLEYATPKNNVPTADSEATTAGYLSSFKTRKTLPTILAMP